MATQEPQGRSSARDPGPREARSDQPREIDYESLRDHGRALRDAAAELRTAAQQALADAERLARNGVRDRPYVVLGAAFAAGWVIGGGVPVRFTTLATGAVGRAALGLAAARVTHLRGNGSSEREDERKTSPEDERPGFGGEESVRGEGSLRHEEPAQTGI
jgi:hypothetical protein